MSRIVMDDVLREKLKGLTESVEIVDETGKAVALFVPLPLKRSILGQMECPLSEEELERRANDSRPRLTTEQLLANLGLNGCTKSIGPGRWIGICARSSIRETP